MLVNLREILAPAKGYAVPAFNTYNLETVMGVIRGAEEQRAPVIIQVYSRLFKEGSGYYLAPVIMAAARAASVPVCFHLDHGASSVEVVRGIRYGCSGIMIDASKRPVEENIALTRDIVRQCGYAGIPVEGEIGHVGTVDDAVGEATTVEEAKTFAEATGVAALAIAVGTAHGRYRRAPKLDIQRISQIKAATAVPLVLHGGSGVPDGQIQEAIRAGISKINFGTDVCRAFLDAVFAASRDVYAVDLFMKPAISSVQAFAESKIKLLGAGGRA